MKIKLTRARVRDMKPANNDILVWDETTPHFALRVRANGTKRYMHIYKDYNTHKQKRTTIGDPQLISIESARSIAMQLNEEIKAGKAKIKTQKPLFADYANDVWMPQREKFIKPSSLARNRLALDKQLLPAFGRLRLDEITKSVVLKWFNHYSRAYPGGANRTLEVLVGILNHAVKAKLIKTNHAYNIVRNPKRKMNRFLSDEERALLVKTLNIIAENKLYYVENEWHTASNRWHSAENGRYSAEKRRYYADAIKLLLLTGCRAGEIVGLRWSEVGADRFHLEDSKVGARTVWLSKDAIILLKNLRERRPSDSLYVFPHSGGKAAQSWYVLLLEFWVILRSKLNMRDVRLHDLRHSFATQAVRQGIGIPVVSKLLGHRKIEMTMRYTHASNTDAEAAAERIGKQIAALLEGRAVAGELTQTKGRDKIHRT